MLAELGRAAKPPVTAISRLPASTSLAPVAAWQNAQFGTWPGYETGWVSETEALGLPVISAFLETLTALVMQMPLNAYTAGDLIQPTPPILRNPAPGPNRVLADWVVEALRTLALRGNYVAVLGDDAWTGWPEVMYPVPAGQWSVTVNAAGTVEYTIGGRIYPATDVFHVRRNCEPGELVGRGLLDTHAQLIAAAVAAERWAARYYEGGAVPPAVFTSPDPDLTQAQADELKAKYQTVAMTRQTLIVPAGHTLQTLASDAEKAQLADTRHANDQKLAIACGIPGAMLGLEGPSLTYRNISDVWQQFITGTVMGYLEPIEQHLSAWCLPRGTEARFETAAVLRPDYPGRVALAEQGYKSGVMTRDEARALVDLPPAEPEPEPVPVEGPELEVVAS